jgi:hypothetical protein
VPFLTLGRPPLSPGCAGCHGAGRSVPSHGRYLRRCAARHGVIRFQHLRKISSILIRNTVVPRTIRTTPGSCSLTEGVKSPKPGVVMSVIPLDFQRRCERRSAARFSLRAEPVASRKQGPERGSQQIAEPAEAKRKTRRLNPGLRLVPPE